MNERANKQTNKQTSGTILYVIDDDDDAAVAIITTKDSHRYPHLPADCIPEKKSQFSIYVNVSCLIRPTMLHIGWPNQIMGKKCVC